MKRGMYGCLLAIAVINVGLAVWNGMVAPKGMLIWIIGACFVPIGIVGIGMQASSDRPAAAKKMQNSMFGAGLMIGAAFVVTAITEIGWVPNDTAYRIIHIALGVGTMISGNLLPKTNLPINEIKGNAAACDRQQRRIGRTQTIAGLAMVVAALILPATMGSYAILTIGGVLFVSIIGRPLWAKTVSRR